MERYKAWKKAKYGDGNRNFIKRPPDDHGHKLSPAFLWVPALPPRACTRQLRGLTAAGSRRRDRIFESIVVGICARTDTASENVPNLHVITATRNVASTQHWRPLMRRLEHPGTWTNKGCWRTTLIGTMAWSESTVRASPRRGSGQGKKERGTLA